jgi:hypothetical protein
MDAPLVNASGSAKCIDWGVAISIKRPGNAKRGAGSKGMIAGVRV